MRTKLTFLLSLALSLLGCTHARQATWKLQTRDEMREAIRQRIPPGTSLGEAQAFMESEGFSCTVKRDSLFIERTAWHDQGRFYQGIDFLECQRQQSAGNLLMSSNWTVALVLKGDAVSDVLVSHYVDGS